jgi:hypothetical protein
MKAVGFVQLLLVFLVTMACLPQAVWAAHPSAEQPSVVADVAMTVDGRLIGRVVDGHGQPLGGTPVAVFDQHRQAATTTTDPGGYFAIAGLPSGVYQVAAGEGRTFCRVWAAAAAPPGAYQGVLVVADADLVRGQLGSLMPFGGMGGFGGFGMGGLSGIFSNAWFAAAAVSASVAAPVAAHNAERNRIESQPSSP